MTLPSEEMDAINYAGDFLLKLCQPIETPRVPIVIRDMARRILRHFPVKSRIKIIYRKGGQP